MNGLPTDVNLSFLIGAQLIQLCFGENEVQLHFDNGASVVVEGEIVAAKAHDTGLPISQYGAAATRLCEALGAQVRAADRSEEGGLLLRFAEGEEWHIVNSNQSFESFQIHDKGKTYVA